MDSCGLSLAQLHGDETAAYCQELGRPVMKALRLKDRASFLALAEFQGRAGIRGFVLDAFSEKAYGGTGQVIDWGLAAEAAKAATILLAGGLTPDNVAEAIRAAYAGRPTLAPEAIQSLIQNEPPGDIYAHQLGHGRVTGEKKRRLACDHRSREKKSGTASRAGPVAEREQGVAVLARRRGQRNPVALETERHRRVRDTSDIDAEVSNSKDELLCVSHRAGRLLFTGTSLTASCMWIACRTSS